MPRPGTSPPPGRRRLTGWSPLTGPSGRTISAWPTSGEYFSGLVNGSDGITSAAVIQTNCFGPVQPGQTGHPLAGQSVEVELAKPPVSANGDIGFTGNANSITAFLSWPYPASTTAPQLVAKFSDYYVKEPIPVTLTVPCGGQGAVTFTPASSSTTSRPATVVVTFLSQP